jgi:hypothetical protein
MPIGRGPFPRPDWPPAEGRPPLLQAEPGCLDAQAVSAEAFAAWLRAEGQAVASRYAGRQWAAGKAADRVTWSDAAAFCQSRGGALPGVAQWETAVRSSQPPLLLGLKGEWSSEAFPTASFGYGVDQLAHCSQPETCMRVVHEGLIAQPRHPGPRLRWVRRLAGRGLPAIGWRCVVPYRQVTPP